MAPRSGSPSARAGCSVDELEPRVPARGEVDPCTFRPVRSPHLASCKCSSCVGWVPNVIGLLQTPKKRLFRRPSHVFTLIVFRPVFSKQIAVLDNVRPHPRKRWLLSLSTRSASQASGAEAARAQTAPSAVTWSCKWLQVTRILGAPSRSCTVADLFGLGFLPENDLGWAVRRGSKCPAG